MSVTVTSLVHPTMIKKIREGLKYAALNQGHKMNGHRNRVYIANAKGHNILRIDWKGQGKFIAYGRESKDVTEMVKEAIQRGCSANRVSPRPSPETIAFVKSNPSLQERLGKLAALAGLSLAVTGCSSSGAMTAFYSVVGSLFT
ncbi:hypothetical protein VCM_00003 [Pseudomonas phage VCM]|uniref:Uncharacterized protein n=1 Tax=Pseudomonas phage VCM TaxID=1729937 RepID=A0A0S4KYU0_9CAUD|nr:hypothetical protein VCM_00003 [Pseudomonas phage VCM]CUR44222.1 hypothetical protein VCM_00003 [Pseudomonas phage VCM]